MASTNTGSRSRQRSLASREGLLASESLSEKGSDPLRRGSETAAYSMFFHRGTRVDRPPVLIRLPKIQTPSSPAVEEESDFVPPRELLSTQRRQETQGRQELRVDPPSSVAGPPAPVRFPSLASSESSQGAAPESVSVAGTAEAKWNLHPPHAAVAPVAPGNPEVLEIPAGQAWAEILGSRLIMLLIFVAIGGIVLMANRSKRFPSSATLATLENPAGESTESAAAEGTPGQETSPQGTDRQGTNRQGSGPRQTAQSAALRSANSPPEPSKPEPIATSQAATPQANPTQATTPTATPSTDIRSTEPAFDLQAIMASERLEMSQPAGTAADAPAQSRTNQSGAGQNNSGQNSTGQGTSAVQDTPATQGPPATQGIPSLETGANERQAALQPTTSGIRSGGLTGPGQRSPASAITPPTPPAFRSAAETRGNIIRERSENVSLSAQEAIDRATEAAISGQYFATGPQEPAAPQWQTTDYPDAIIDWTKYLPPIPPATAPQSWEYLQGMEPGSGAAAPQIPSMGQPPISQDFPSAQGLPNAQGFPSAQGLPNSPGFPLNAPAGFQPLPGNQSAPGRAFTGRQQPYGPNALDPRANNGLPPAPGNMGSWETNPGAAAPVPTFGGLRGPTTR